LKNVKILYHQFHRILCRYILLLVLLCNISIAIFLVPFYICCNQLCLCFTFMSTELICTLSYFLIWFPFRFVPKKFHFW